MSGKNKKQFGVWMDSNHAIVVGREHVDTGKFIILGHEKAEDPQADHNSEHTSNNAERTTLHKLFRGITAHMQNVDELHVTGTGTAQEQFIHYLRDIPQFKHAEAKESTSNRMTDASLIEYVTAQFGQAVQEKGN